MTNQNQAPVGAPKRVAPANPNPQIKDGPKPNSEVSGVEKIAAMADAFPDDTPNQHVLYGYGGYRLTVGDLREVAKLHASVTDGNAKA